ncbi:MAG: stalk domain-containing protein, partial [Bacillota bacterium]|nr:stalk domain-containing protein [Bacillota bacterium]
MKIKMKILPMLLSIIFCLCACVGIFADTQENISICIDGRNIKTDVNPVILQGRTLVPLRSISEAVGASVNWDKQSQGIELVYGNKKVNLSIGSTMAYDNGRQVFLEVPPQIINGRTMVPIRFVAECFGFNISWNNKTNTVIIETNTDRLMKVHFLDVGQGDSIFIQLPNG